MEEGRIPSRHRCGHPHHHRRTSKQQQQQQKRASRSNVYQNHRYPEFRLHPLAPQQWPGEAIPAPPSAFPNQFEFFLHRPRNEADSASSLAGAVGSADEVVTYAYRFTGDSGVDREEIPFGRHYPGGGRLGSHNTRRLNRRHGHHSRQSLHAPLPPPNSQSSSPATTGSSPEAVAVAAGSSALSAPLTTSPASPMEDEDPRPPPLSILRSSSAAIGSMKKSVQWVSDGKRRPQDISRHDRRLVKNQVE